MVHGSVAKKMFRKSGGRSIFLELDFVPREELAALELEQSTHVTEFIQPMRTM